MPPLILPTLLSAASTPLVLTPGTYTQLTLDTLGDTDPSQDAALAAADDAEYQLGQTGQSLSDMDSDVATMASVSNTVDPSIADQMAADLTPAATAVGADLGYFASATIVLAVPDTPQIPPDDPVPIAGLTFQAGEVIQQGNVTVAAAGGSVGGVPSAGDDFTWFLESVPVGTTTAIPLLATVFDPAISGGRLVMTLDPSSDPSITIGQQASNPQQTLNAWLYVTPTDAGHHSARIYITSPEFSKAKVFTVTYQAA